MAINAKFNYPDGKGGYTTFHLETNADQVIDLEEVVKKKITNTEEAIYEANERQKALRNHMYGQTKIPVQVNVPIYDGNDHAPEFEHFDKIKMEMGGKVYATEAGMYTARFTPKDFVVWEDGTTGAKDVTWRIDKAPCDLNFSHTEVCLTDEHPSQDILVTKPHQGIRLTATTPSKVTSSISNNEIITLTGTGSVIGSLTVQNLSDANYDIGIKTVNIISNVTEPLENYTVEDIIDVIRSGRAAKTWQIGDSIPVVLNGSVCGLEFDNFPCRIVLIGVNHNQRFEGRANRAHFMIGQNYYGKDIAFCSPTYGTYGRKQKVADSFLMNEGNTNIGGWVVTAMRNIILPAFKALLPVEWQAAIGTVRKYTNNDGGSSALPSSVTYTNDELFLLSEYEIFGITEEGHVAEGNFQEQYEYFKSGNHLIRYRHDVDPLPEPEEPEEDEDLIPDENGDDLAQAVDVDGEVTEPEETVEPEQVSQDPVQYWTRTPIRSQEFRDIHYGTNEGPAGFSSASEGIVPVFTIS